MRPSLYISSLSLLVLAGCPLGDKSIGGLDSSTGDAATQGSSSGGEEPAETDPSHTGDPTGGTGPGNTSGERDSFGEESSGSETGDGVQECVDGLPFELDFTLDGVDPGDIELDLSCAASPDGPVVTFTNCTDGGGAPQPDVVLTLSGDWLGPFATLDPIEGEATLQYVQQTVGAEELRWLVVATPQLGPAIIGVDANDFQPTLGTIDYGPVFLDPDPLSDCPETSFDCDPEERLAIMADYSGDLREVPHGNQIVDLGAADGGDSTQYVMTVARASSYVDGLCADMIGRRLVVGLLAYPNS